MITTTLIALAAVAVIAYLARKPKCASCGVRHNLRETSRPGEHLCAKCWGEQKHWSV